MATTASASPYLASRFNTVVTSAAGFPLDQTYYQTVKGMVTPLDILAPGGTLIIASARQSAMMLPPDTDEIL